MAKQDCCAGGTPGDSSNLQPGVPDAAQLRAQAERKAISLEVPEIESMSPGEIRRMFHELRVRQIEFEIENDHLRQVQTEQNESRARYPDLFDAAQVGFCTLSEQGLIEEANLTVATLLGVARSDLPGQPLAQFVLPDDQEIYHRHRQNLFETRQPQVCELRMRKKDGATVWTQVIAAARRDANGRPSYFFTIRDMTDRKRVEDDLLFHRMMFNETGRIAKVGGWRFDAITGEGSWTEEVARIHDLDSVLAISRDVGMRYYTDESRPIIAAAVKAAVEQAVPYDLELEIVSAKGVRKWIRTIGHPVTEDGRVVRVVGSFQDVTDRKRDEAAQRQTVERLELALEGGQMGMWEWDLVSGRHEWSRQMEALYGYAPGTFPGTTEGFTARIHPDDLGEMWRIGENARQSRTAFRFELRVIWPDGSLHWVASHGRYTYHAQGQAVRLVGVAFDITERKLAEEALRASHERLKKVLEIETVGVMFWDLTTGFMTDANDAFLRLMGYSRREVEARELTWQKLTPPEYLEVSLAEIRKFQMTGRVGPYEKEYLRKDGTRQWLLFAGSSLGGNACVEFCVDIAERKQAEMALKTSEAQLQSVLDSTSAIIYVKDVEGHYLRINRRYEELFHVTRKQFVGKTDYDLFSKEVADVLRANDRRVLETAAQMETEEHVPQDDGTHTYISVKFPLYDASGAIYAVCGISADITARKRAEGELKRHALELEQFNRLSVGRELRMIELKRQVNELSARLGQPPPYPKVAAPDETGQ